ncbi:MAG: class I SAM-dependent methyltransferase [Bacteroidota bacterium]
MIDQINHPEVQQFISKHENADTSGLLLKHKHIAGVPMPVIVDQIVSKKKAKSKLPEWYRTQGLVFPPPLSLEQCSSEIAAKYKSHLYQGKSIVDLTGGMGVDSYYFSRAFESVDYVEKSQQLCQLATHNFEKLKAFNINVHHTNTKGFISSVDKTYDVAFIDPSRRNEQKGKVHLLEDCEPNVIDFEQELVSKAKTIILKTSPLLDVTKAIKSLKNVVKVLIISVDNECKEVLYILASKREGSLTYEAVNLMKTGEEHLFSFSPEQESILEVEYSLPDKYILEPNASIMKSGGFKSLAKAFHLKKLHSNSHLFTSDQPIAGFPGKTFHLKAVEKLDRKKILSHLDNDQANVVVRNFPLNTTGIKNKLGVIDGGNTFLFATTLLHNKKVVLITERV